MSRLPATTRAPAGRAAVTGADSDETSTASLKKLLAAERAAIRSGIDHPFFSRSKTGTSA